MGFSDLQAWKVNEETKRRRLRLQMPQQAHQTLTQALSSLRAYVGPRAWGLPDTRFEDEVRHYVEQKRKLDVKGPDPELRSVLLEEETTALSLKIAASLRFLSLAVDADDFVKPILYYYSCAHLCGVLSRSFFTWRGQDNHGLTHGERTPEDVGRTQVKVKEHGQLPRLATTLFLLMGWPNCFSSLVTYTQRPKFHTAPGELLEQFCKEERGAPIQALTLRELHEFDYHARVSALRRRHGFHKFNGTTPTAVLVDVTTLFLASSIARYDVLGWQAILEAKRNSYRQLFEETFDRYRTFTADAFLRAIESPVLALGIFKNGETPYQPSPFSSSHPRFKGDPNCS